MMTDIDFSILGFLKASLSRILTAHYPSADCELWINRNEYTALGSPTSPTTLFGLPVHASIAIPAGQVAVFDRSRMIYLRDPACATPPARNLIRSTTSSIRPASSELKRMADVDHEPLKVNLDINRMNITPHEVAVHDGATLLQLISQLNSRAPGFNEALAWATANRSCPPNVRLVAAVLDEQIAPGVAEFRDWRGGVHRMSL